MRLRVVIFDDEPAIRQVLGALCADRGYEVFTFSDPGLYPLYAMPRCPCPPRHSVGGPPALRSAHARGAGVGLVETLMRKQCVAPHLGLMSGAWSAAARARAARLGCRLFTKPFAIAELLAWFDTAEAQVAPTRALLEWQAHGWRIEPPAPGE